MHKTSVIATPETKQKIMEVIDFHVRLLMIASWAVQETAESSEASQPSIPPDVYLDLFNTYVEPVVAATVRAYWRGSISPYLSSYLPPSKHDPAVELELILSPLRNAIYTFVANLNNGIEPFGCDLRGFKNTDELIPRFMTIGALCDYVLLSNDVPSNDQIATSGWASVMDLLVESSGESETDNPNPLNLARLNISSPYDWLVDCGGAVIWYLSKLPSIPFSCAELVLNLYSHEPTNYTNDCSIVGVPFASYQRFYRHNRCRINSYGMYALSLSNMQYMDIAVSASALDLFNVVPFFSVLNDMTPLDSFTSYKKLPKIHSNDRDKINNRVFVVSTRHLDTIDPFIALITDNIRSMFVCALDLDDPEQTINDVDRICKLFSGIDAPPLRIKIVFVLHTHNAEPVSNSMYTRYIMFVSKLMRIVVSHAQALAAINVQFLLNMSWFLPDGKDEFVTALNERSDSFSYSIIDGTTCLNQSPKWSPSINYTVGVVSHPCGKVGATNVSVHMNPTNIRSNSDVYKTMYNMVKRTRIVSGYTNEPVYADVHGMYVVPTLDEPTEDGRNYHHSLVDVVDYVMSV